FLLEGDAASPLDLHERNSTSRYWYTGGFNPIGIISWACAAITGVLFFGSDDIFDGVFYKIIGIDFSLPVTILGGGGLYYVLRKIFQNSLYIKRSGQTISK